MKYQYIRCAGCGQMIMRINFQKPEFHLDGCEVFE